MKPLLAVSTSGKLCSVALLLNNEDYISYNFNKNQVHSEKLIGMIDIILKESRININECEGIAVSIGPGSFTGLRIGLSAVKALAFGAGLPIYPISEFDAMAMFAKDTVTINKTFNMALKVNRDEVYFVKYIKTDEGFRAVKEVEIVSVEDVDKNIDTNELVFGNINLKNIVQINGIDATFIAKYALLYGKDLLTFNFDYLEPNYIKNFIPRC